MTGFIEIPLIIAGVVAAVAGAVAAAVGVTVLVIVGIIVTIIVVYIILEMLSILIILAYFALIPVAFFLACLAVPFILAVGIPVLGPLLLFVAPKLTFLDYLIECFCKCMSCIIPGCFKQECSDSVKTKCCDSNASNSANSSNNLRPQIVEVSVPTESRSYERRYYTTR